LQPFQPLRWYCQSILGGMAGLLFNVMVEGIGYTDRIMERNARCIPGLRRWAVAAALAGLALAGSAGCRSGDGPPAPPPRTAASDPRPEGPVVRILGTVQDGGLPHAACACTRCDRARQDPAFRRQVASLGVVFPREGRSYLIDATPDIRPQLDALREACPREAGRTDRKPVDGILLTHAHIGHYLGLAFLGFEAIHSKRVPVYCSPALAEFLAGNAPWDQLVRLENIVVREVTHGQTIELHPRLSVTVVPVPHRDEYADTVGFVLQGPERRLLYVPDTDTWEAWDPSLIERLAEIDIAILDGTFFSPDELPGRDVTTIGHPLIERSLELLAPLVARGDLQVYFTHLNHSNPALDPDGEAARRIAARGFHIAREGQEFPL
jgi:pyrroloquinoline quinone biosynthesis protein B